MARLIDADLPMEQMEKLLDHHLMMGNFSADSAVSDCIEFLKTAPTIDAEPVRHGHWIPWLNAKDEFDRQFTAIYMCSECKTATNYYQYNYCPDCGADMRGNE